MGTFKTQHPPTNYCFKQYEKLEFTVTPLGGVIKQLKTPQQFSYSVISKTFIAYVLYKIK